MIRQIGRLVLVGVCCMAMASAAHAQLKPLSLDLKDFREPPKGSHRPLDSGIDDMIGAEELLARRLHHTHDVQEMQDLLKPYLKDPQFQNMLRAKLANGADLAKLQDTLRNNPEVLDDPRLRDMLKNLEPLKQNGEINSIPKDKRDALAQGLKDFINKHQPPDPTDPGPMTDKPPNGQPPMPDLNHDASASPSAPPTPPEKNWLNRDVIEGMAGVLKDMDRSAEGDKLRADLMRELGKMDAGPNGSSEGMADFLKNIISSEDAAWLAHNLKFPEGPKIGPLPEGPSLSAGSSLGGDSAVGVMDSLVWIVAVVLLGVAAFMVVAMMRNQAAAARAKAWSAGPWPVDPSRVSTREELIRAFEYLAFLLLGPGARTLNHLEVAARVGGTDDRRAEAAARLAHLYEQARYAPPDEPLPENELTAARGDLSALAGAAA